jgi:D-serine deaminase-like pyridoxal phosphate-dependent protein
MPLGLDRLREANRLASFLRQSHDDARFRVFVDSLTQVQALNEYAESEEVDKSGLPWSVMIKLDGGYHRAGFTVQSDDLKLAIKQCLASPHIDLYGF